jgi:hypothetical protein
MPSHHRSRRDQHKRPFPAGPEFSQNNPEQLMRGRQLETGSSAVQSKQLLSERQVFEKEILAGAEQANHPADEVPKRGDHSVILSPCRISVSLQVVHFPKAKGFDEAQGIAGSGSGCHGAWRTGEHTREQPRLSLPTCAH